MVRIRDVYLGCQLQHQKRGKFFSPSNFFGTNIYKIVNNFIFEQGKNFLAKTKNYIVLFTQKFVIKLRKIWVWDLGSEIGDPGSTRHRIRILVLFHEVFVWVLSSLEKPRFLLLVKQHIYKKNKEPECEWCCLKAPSRRSPIPRAIAAPPQSHWTAGQELSRGPDGRWAGAGDRRGWRAGRRRRDRFCSVVEP